MELEWLSDTFVIYQLAIQELPPDVPFAFYAHTDAERSVVCPVQHAPRRAQDGAHYRGFRFAGVLDFSLVGVLAQLSALLAAAGIQIFAVSTYNTDYIFVPAQKAVQAGHILQENGYSFLRSL